MISLTILKAATVILR
jgi:hypothetical protein